MLHRPRRLRHLPLQLLLTAFLLLLRHPRPLPSRHPRLRRLRHRAAHRRLQLLP